MLSYQHAYHAGNLADIHKHAALACVMDYLTQKDKPLTYIETHAGRGLYNLDAAESQKTGEASIGIRRFLKEQRIPDNHPYLAALAAVRSEFGQEAYPGSPLIAAHFMRADDKMHLAEMHPQEVTALREAMAHTPARITQKDGLKHTNRITPPEPRRGMLVIDPSYEVKSDYMDMAEFIIKMHRKWNVATILLWYPVLKKSSHSEMIAALDAANMKDTLRHEIDFTHLNNPDHGMTGSGLFIVNAPFGLPERLEEIAGFFK